VVHRGSGVAEQFFVFKDDKQSLFGDDRCRQQPPPFSKGGERKIRKNSYNGKYQSLFKYRFGLSFVRPVLGVENPKIAGEKI
jgi:hypothetical protein